MKIYGYQNNSNDLLKLGEVSFECSIEELEKLVSFFNKVKMEHTAVESKTGICHSHFRDWNKEWQKEEPDVIVVTKYE